MPNLHVLTGAGESPTYPIIRKIGFADLKDAVAKGIDDFCAMPTHVIFLAIVYPVVGLFLARMTFGHDVMPLLFPLAAGFALISPFAAIGLYELSRQREKGVDVSWKHAFAALRCRSRDGIAALGMVLMIVFLIWLITAQWLYQSLFGYGSPESIGQFLSDILTTSEGWILIIAGNGIGFLFAVLVLTISVVSFPLLLDRDVGAMVAMHTSVRAVLRNPLMMAAWGLFVAVTLVIGSLPFFVGLAVVLPVLAHSTWHLYRKVVEPEPQGRGTGPEPATGPRATGPLARPKGRRYAADYPAGPTRMGHRKRNLGRLAASVRNPAAQLHRHRRWI
jgi:uncharacterized membrane protein